MKRVEVAIGIVVRPSHEVLICQRRKGDAFADLWEFPGGKLEPGETPAACAQRELLEELSIEVEIDRPLTPVHHAYPTFEVTLYPFVCRHVAGEPRANASQQFRWVPVGQLPDYSFPEGNRLLMAELLQTPLQAPETA